jgi:transcriptional regulator with XRE-family HTH domain
MCRQYLTVLAVVRSSLARSSVVKYRFKVYLLAPNVAVGRLRCNDIWLLVSSSIGTEHPMPPRGVKTGLQAEEYAAQNIQLLRETRGWSQRTLARKLARIGHPLLHTAIYKIEKGTPTRRRISVDDLVAFSIVFDVTLDQLVADPVAGSSLALVRKFEEWQRMLAQHEEMASAQQVERQATEDQIIELVVMSGKTPRRIKAFLASPATGAAAKATSDLFRRIERAVREQRLGKPG